MINNEALATEVINDLSKILRKEIDPLKLNANLVEDYGADSMDIVDIVDSLEVKYGLTIPNEQIPNIKTIQDILQLIQSRSEC
jgi:acyl carrier protein